MDSLKIFKARVNISAVILDRREVRVIYVEYKLMKVNCDIKNIKLFA